MDGLYEQVRIALHQVWRRRWLALAVAWGVALAGWLAIALIPNSYEAKARLLVQSRTVLPSQADLPNDRQNDLIRLKQSLTSNENLTRIVRATDLNGLVASARDLEAEVAALRGRIEVVAQPDNLIEIKAKSNLSTLSNGQNARTAAATVQHLIDFFVEANLAGSRQDTGRSLQFLDEELRKREADLAAAEQRRVEFEQRHLGLLPGEGSAAQRLSAARLELAGIEQQVVAAQSALNGIRAQLGATPPNLPGSGAGPGPASSQLAALEQQLAQNVARGWTDSHPDVAALRQQIDRLRPAAQAEQRGAGAGAASNPSYVSLRAMMAEREAQLVAAQTRRAQLQRDMEQLAARQASEPGAAAEQARLNRDFEVLKQQYDRLLQDREQVRLRGDVETRANPVTMQVIEPPVVPSVPAAPNRPIFLAAVLVAALGAGVGAAFVMGQLQTTFPTQNRLAQVTGLPVLGTVSEVVSPAERTRRRQRLVWLMAGTGALFAGWLMLTLVEFWQRSTVA
jgi:polysaccharide biosynthesis transport protein